MVCVKTSRMAARAAAILLVVTSAACALSLKQKAVVGFEAGHAVLAQAQDLERDLYAKKTVPALTPQMHEKISAAFSQAFEAETKVGPILIAWRAGDPAPQGLDAYYAAIQEALGVAKTIGYGRLIGKIEDGAKEVKDVIDLFRR